MVAISQIDVISSFPSFLAQKKKNTKEKPRKTKCGRAGLQTQTSPLRCHNGLEWAIYDVAIYDRVERPDGSVHSCCCNNNHMHYKSACTGRTHTLKPRARFSKSAFVQRFRYLSPYHTPRLGKVLTTFEFRPNGHMNLPGEFHEFVSVAVSHH